MVTDPKSYRGQSRRRKGDKEFKPSRSDVNEAVQEYLKKGGKISTLDTKLSVLNLDGTSSHLIEEEPTTIGEIKDDYQ